MLQTSTEEALRVLHAAMKEEARTQAKEPTGEGGDEAASSGAPSHEEPPEDVDGSEATGGSAHKPKSKQPRGPPKQRAKPPEGSSARRNRTESPKPSGTRGKA